MANIRKSLKTFVLAVAMIFTNMSIALPVVSAADDTSSETYVTEIKGANMTIGQDLSLNYYATLADEHKDATMHFVMSNGKEDDVKGVYDAKQGVYKFTLNAIPPQTMGDTIDATLKLGDEVLDEHTGYSVKAYAQSQFTKYPNDAELKQLLTDMLYYGEAAQLYRNYETDALVTNDVQGIGTPSDESILPTESGMLNQVDPNTTARFTSAGVWFDYNNRLYIKFNTTEGVTVKVNGEAVTFDGAMYNTNGIYAVDFDKVYTFELYEGETLANRIEYSIKAYVYNTMNKKGEDGQLTNMAKLVRALYAYGKSAEAYRDAKPENVIVGDNSATTIVIPTLDNKVSSAVSMSTENGAITAYVPAGVALATDTDMLTLKVNDMADSKAEISLEKTESAFSINVHIDGISANNDVATKITIKELLPVGLNMGNYRFYHVENGETVEMILLADGATPVHNNFEYDPATGDVVLYLTSFSEIALVADDVNAWNGEYDYSWYTNAVAPVDGESVTEYTIANADQLAAFGAIVGGMNGQTQDSFDGKYVKLLADINLGDAEKENNSNIIFYPIGYYNSTGSYEKTSGETVTSEVYSFEGTFDGNGNTISNFYQNTWEMKGDYNDGYPAGSNHYKDAMGLFGYVNGGTIKNLTVDNFSSDGEFTPTGVIAAYAVNSTFENIAITNCNPRVYNTGNGGIVGIGGNSDDTDTYKLTFTNITIDNTNKISALWGSWDVACGGLVGMFRGAGHVYMTNCHVAAQMDVYNDVCGNYQYYWYRYSGMMIGTNKNMITDEDGYTVPETDKFHAENCTVHFGEWNDYYYCELVANSLASYTHDHQFSRLEEISSLDEIKSGDTWTKAGNFLLISGDTKTCYHIVNNDGTLKQHLHTDSGEETVNDKTVLKEDKQIVYLPFNQLFTGYGWGVKHIPVYNGEDYAFDGITILDREVADSVEKFESKFKEDFLYRVGNQNTVALGSLFGAAAKLDTEGKELLDENNNIIYWDINDSGVYVTIEKVDENTNVSGTYTPNTTDWTQGTIQFSDTGVVKVTIQDYNYCKPTELYLEVVDATNAISKTDVTSKNVVLLNDISGGFTVSNGFSLYGNGFKATCSGDGSYRSAALSYGFVTVETGGTLDNLQIICDIFPESYMYTGEMEAGSDGRYPYGYSAVVINGNSTISNCYIYGARNNILVGDGNVTIKNTVTECGSLSNIQIKSTDAYTVTLDDVTTIQYITKSNYDTSKTVMGFGVIVGDNESTSNPTIKLLGDLKQYNWVTSADASELSNDYAKEVISGAVKVTDYQHTIINATVTVNMGIAYLNENAATITDERENKETIQYMLSTISISLYKGQVYSITSTSGITSDSRYDPNTDKVIPYAPNANGYILPTISMDNVTNDAVTITNGYNETEKCHLCKIVVDLDNIDGGSYEFKFSDLNVKKHGVNLAFTVKGSDGNPVDKDTAITLNQLFKEEYTLEITDNMIYGAGAVKEDAKNCSYPVVLQATKTSIEPPKFTNAGTATAIRLVEKTGGDWRPAYTVLTGVSVTYWSASESKVKTVDLSTLYNSGNISSNVWTYTCDDYTLTITGGAVHSDGTTITPVVANDTLYFASTNKAFGTGTTSRSIVLTYVFTDKNDSTTWNRTETVTYSNLSEYDYNSFKNDGTLTEPSSGGGFPCVTPETLVTLADGTQKRIDAVTYADKLLVWNFKTGNYDVASASILMNHGANNVNVTTLNFADGTSINTINGHGFFDVATNEFVLIDEHNVADYVGHDFVKQDGDGYSTTTLVSYRVEEQYTEVWSILTAEHYNCILEGMWTITAAEVENSPEWLMPYEIGEDMKYDEAKMKADIETYGLYTYDDFAEYCTYEQFVALSLENFKVSVGKGYITWEEILYLISIHIG